MKRIIVKNLRVISFALLLAGFAPAALAKNLTQPCSLSSLKGFYSMQGQGTVLQYPGMPTPFPLAEVGRDFLDGAGNIHGHFTANGDGFVVEGTSKERIQ